MIDNINPDRPIGGENVQLEANLKMLRDLAAAQPPAVPNANEIGLIQAYENNLRESELMTAAGHDTTDYWRNLLSTRTVDQILLQYFAEEDLPPLRLLLGNYILNLLGNSQQEQTQMTVEDVPALPTEQLKQFTRVVDIVNLAWKVEMLSARANSIANENAIAEARRLDNQIDAKINRVLVGADALTAPDANAIAVKKVISILSKYKDANTVDELEQALLKEFLPEVARLSLDAVNDPARLRSKAFLLDKIANILLENLADPLVQQVAQIGKLNLNMSLYRSDSDTLLLLANLSTPTELNSVLVNRLNTEVAPYLESLDASPGADAQYARRFAGMINPFLILDLEETETLSAAQWQNRIKIADLTLPASSGGIAGAYLRQKSMIQNAKAQLVQYATPEIVSLFEELNHYLDQAYVTLVSTALLNLQSPAQISAEDYAVVHRLIPARVAGENHLTLLYNLDLLTPTADQAAPIDALIVVMEKVLPLEIAQALTAASPILRLRAIPMLQRDNIQVKALETTAEKSIKTSTKIFEVGAELHKLLNPNQLLNERLNPDKVSNKLEQIQQLLRQDLGDGQTIINFLETYQATKTTLDRESRWTLIAGETSLNQVQAFFAAGLLREDEILDAIGRNQFSEEQLEALSSSTDYVKTLQSMLNDTRKEVLMRKAIARLDELNADLEQAKFELELVAEPEIAAAKQTFLELRVLASEGMPILGIPTQYALDRAIDDQIYEMVRSEADPTAPTTAELTTYNFLNYLTNLAREVSDENGEVNKQVLLSTINKHFAKVAKAPGLPKDVKLTAQQVIAYWLNHHVKPTEFANLTKYQRQLLAQLGYTVDLSVPAVVNRKPLEVIAVPVARANVLRMAKHALVGEKDIVKNVRDSIETLQRMREAQIYAIPIDGNLQQWLPGIDVTIKEPKPAQINSIALTFHAEREKIAKLRENFQIVPKLTSRADVDVMLQQIDQAYRIYVLRIANELAPQDKKLEGDLGAALVPEVVEMLKLPELAEIKSSMQKLLVELPEYGEYADTYVGAVEGLLVSQNEQLDAFVEFLEQNKVAERIEKYLTEIAKAKAQFFQKQPYNLSELNKVLKAIKDDYNRAFAAPGGLNLYKEESEMALKAHEIVEYFAFVEPNKEGLEWITASGEYDQLFRYANDLYVEINHNLSLLNKLRPEINNIEETIKLNLIANLPETDAQQRPGTMTNEAGEATLVLLSFTYGKSNPFTTENAIQELLVKNYKPDEDKSRVYRDFIAIHDFVGNLVSHPQIQLSVEDVRRAQEYLTKAMSLYLSPKVVNHIRTLNSEKALGLNDDMIAEAFEYKPLQLPLANRHNLTPEQVESMHPLVEVLSKELTAQEKQILYIVSPGLRLAVQRYRTETIQQMQTTVEGKFTAVVDGNKIPELHDLAARIARIDQQNLDFNIASGAYKELGNYLNTIIPPLTLPDLIAKAEQELNELLTDAEIINIQQEWQELTEWIDVQQVPANTMQQMTQNLQTNVNTRLSDIEYIRNQFIKLQALVPNIDEDYRLTSKKRTGLTPILLQKARSIAPTLTRSKKIEPINLDFGAIPALVLRVDIDDEFDFMAMVPTPAPIVDDLSAAPLKAQTPEGKSLVATYINSLSNSSSIELLLNALPDETAEVEIVFGEPAYAERFIQEFNYVSSKFLPYSSVETSLNEMKRLEEYLTHFNSITSAAQLPSMIDAVQRRINLIQVDLQAIQAYPSLLPAQVGDFLDAIDSEQTKYLQHTSEGIEALLSCLYRILDPITNDTPLDLASMYAALTPRARLTAFGTAVVEKIGDVMAQLFELNQMPLDAVDRQIGLISTVSQIGVADLRAHASVLKYIAGLEAAGAVPAPVESTETVSTSQLTPDNLTQSFDQIIAEENIDSSTLSLRGIYDLLYRALGDITPANLKTKLESLHQVLPNYTAKYFARENIGDINEITQQLKLKLPDFVAKHLLENQKLLLQLIAIEREQMAQAEPPEVLATQALPEAQNVAESVPAPAQQPKFAGEFERIISQFEASTELAPNYNELNIQLASLSGYVGSGANKIKRRLRFDTAVGSTLNALIITTLRKKYPDNLNRIGEGAIRKEVNQQIAEIRKYSNLKSFAHSNRLEQVMTIVLNERADLVNQQLEQSIQSVKVSSAEAVKNPTNKSVASTLAESLIQVQKLFSPNKRNDLFVKERNDRIDQVVKGAVLDLLAANVDISGLNNKNVAGKVKAAIAQMRTELNHLRAESDWAKLKGILVQIGSGSAILNKAKELVEGPSEQSMTERTDPIPGGDVIGAADADVEVVLDKDIHLGPTITSLLSVLTGADDGKSVTVPSAPQLEPPAITPLPLPEVEPARPVETNTVSTPLSAESGETPTPAPTNLGTDTVTARTEPVLGPAPVELSANDDQSVEAATQKLTQLLSQEGIPDPEINMIIDFMVDDYERGERELMFNSRIARRLTTDGRIGSANLFRNISQDNLREIYKVIINVSSEREKARAAALAQDDGEVRRRLSALLVDDEDETAVEEDFKKSPEFKTIKALVESSLPNEAELRELILGVENDETKPGALAEVIGRVKNEHKSPRDAIFGVMVANLGNTAIENILETWYSNAPLIEALNSLNDEN